MRVLIHTFTSCSTLPGCSLGLRPVLAPGIPDPLVVKGAFILQVGQVLKMLALLFSVSPLGVIFPVLSILGSSRLLFRQRPLAFLILGSLTHLISGERCIEVLLPNLLYWNMV